MDCAIATAVVKFRLDVNFGDPVTVPGIGSVPRNVARICQWTWECAPPPRGPNQHANAAGYRVIADAILAATKLS